MTSERVWDCWVDGTARRLIHGAVRRAPNRPWPAIAVALVFCCFAGTVLGQSGSSDSHAGTQIGVVRLRQAAKIVPGMSKAKVRSLLGVPWRTVQYNDLDEVENEIWEYRAQDSKGKYRIHIEFNRHDIVRIVGKIPDDVSGGKGTPAQSSSLQPSGERSNAPRFEGPAAA